MELGQKIKERRKEMGLSLRDLAAEVDLTASFLSQVERDVASPSIESLRKISQALDVPVFYFLLEPSGPSPVVRHNERRKLAMPEAHVTYELLTQDVKRKMGIVLAELEPHEGTVPLVKYPNTEECIYVLEGELEVCLGTDAYHLTEGDTIYFDGVLLQSIAPKGEKTVRYLSIITPPIF
ncbi:MAG: XRE family transcriptional regulator [Candidatus Promineifilaceae bacterium]|nr:XRE family transcriptional regulator [Candidatus Promineifilaceae bacterium]